MNNTILSTQFKLPLAVISNGVVTGNEWNNPENLLLVDNEVASSVPSAGVASDVIIGNFNPNIPQNAVVVGIEMQLIAYRGEQTSPNITISPNFVDDTSGENIYYPYVTPFTGLTTSMATYILGTPNYLFASQFTPNQINNMKLALVANGAVFVDSCLVKVYYYIPSDVAPAPVVSGSCEECNSPIQVQAMFLQNDFKVGETKFYLKKGSFSYPDGTPVQPGDVGGCGGEICFVFDEGKSREQSANGEGFEENAVIDLYTGGWQVLPNGVIEVDIGTVLNRGLNFHTPYEHVATLMSNHSANSKVIISNSGRFYSRFVRRCQEDTVFSPPITARWESVILTPALHDLDMLGPGVMGVVDPFDPNKINYYFSGGGGTTPPMIVPGSQVSYTSGDTQVGSLAGDVVVSGLNRGIAIQIATEQLQTVTSVTVGGTPAVQRVVQTDVANNLRSEQWLCIAPPLGTQSIVVTLSGAAYLTFGAECVNGLDPATPVGTVNMAPGNSNTPSVTVVTQYDNSIVLDSLCTALTPILYTPGAGQAQNWVRTANTVTRQGGSSIESAGLQPDNVVMDYSMTQSTPWVITGMELKGITSPGGSGVQSVTSISPFVPVDNTDPLNPVLDFDEVALANDNTFINNLTANALFQSNVNSFVALSGGSGGTKLAIDTTQVSNSGIVETTLYTISIPGGTLRTNDAIRMRMMLSSFNINDNSSGITFRMKYGGATISTVVIQTTESTDRNTTGVFIEGLIVAAGATNAQKGDLTITMGNGVWESDDNVTITEYGTAVTDSTTSQDLVITVQCTNVQDEVIAEAIIVEKISQGASTPVIGEQNLGGDFDNDSFDDVYVPVHTSSSQDGNSLYVKRWAFDPGEWVPILYTRDPNTGMYYQNANGADVVSDQETGGIFELGDYVFVTGENAGAIICVRYDKADLANDTAITVSGGPTAANRGSFSDGTFIYIHTSVAGTWAKYSLAGTTITFVENITGGHAGGVSAIYDDTTSQVLMVDDDGVVYEYNIVGTSFVSVATKTYNFVVSPLAIQSSQAKGISLINANTIYVGYELRITDDDGSAEECYAQLLIKAFSKPSVL